MNHLTAENSEQLLAMLPKWTYDYQRPAIKREVQFDDFTQAFSFMTCVAFRADKMNHHPEWFNVYNKVAIVLTTHDKKCVTSLDIELARYIDEISSAFRGE
jgi:4a-hydroxytetrahydrobiopterin dehydratase